MCTSPLQHAKQSADVLSDYCTDAVQTTVEASEPHGATPPQWKAAQARPDDASCHCANVFHNNSSSAASKGDKATRIGVNASSLVYKSGYLKKRYNSLESIDMTILIAESFAFSYKLLLYQFVGFHR